MPRRVHLPPELRSRAFAVSDAYEAGIGRGRLRSSDLAAPFHGVRAPVRASATVLDRCADALPLLTAGGHRFSHLTAALLWNCPLPRSAESLPLHVSGRRALRVRGIVGHGLSADLGDDRRLGLPVTTAMTTFLQVASLLDEDDLVAVADHLILDPHQLDPHDLRPHTREDVLRERVAAFHGRGAGAAASAVGLMRLGAESRPETLLRLLLGRAGFPDPEVNPTLYTEHGGRLGRADLVYRRWKVVIEYDGDQHRSDVRQYEADIARAERFTRAGWIVVKVRSSGLARSSARTIARVEEAMTGRGWSRA